MLINGASGGVGTFAVQIAKALGAEVTGVCGPTNVALVRSIGADHVIDYTQEDFAANGPRYDLIFDNVGNRSLSDYRRALTRKGTFIPNSNKGRGNLIGGYLAALSKRWWYRFSYRRGFVPWPRPGAARISLSSRTS